MKCGGNIRTAFTTKEKRIHVAFYTSIAKGAENKRNIKLCQFKALIFQCPAFITPVLFRNMSYLINTRENLL